MLRKILLLLSGNAATSLLTFTRNLLVARLISVEDYGIVATFAMAMTVVEMASNLGLQQMIVQSREGDDPKFQSALQGFQLMRGFLSASILFLSAGLIADFLRIPDIAWAYQVMALVPILNALQHFDIHRLNRHMRYLPMLLTGTVPAFVSLLVVWPLAVWLGDFRVMLYALVLQAVMAMVTSHLVAERPFRLSFDPAIIRQAIGFGWPLLINGFLLFAVFQGDKIIVGRELGMEPLALFAMGVTLTLTPTIVIAKSNQNFFLPQLSRQTKSRDTDPAPFEALAQAAIQGAVFNGCVVVILSLFLAPWVITAVLGDKYADLIPLLALFAVQQGMRAFKTGPNLVALSCGNTVNAMLSNAVRVACLPLAWWVVVQGNGIVVLLLVGIAAELLGFMASVRQLRRRQGVTLRGCRRALGLALLLFAVTGALGLGLDPALHDIALWGVVGLFLAVLVAMSQLRRHVLGKP